MTETLLLTYPSQSYIYLSCLLYVCMSIVCVRYQILQIVSDQIVPNWVKWLKMVFLHIPFDPSIQLIKLGQNVQELASNIKRTPLTLQKYPYTILGRYRAASDVDQKLD